MSKAEVVKVVVYIPKDVMNLLSTKDVSARMRLSLAIDLYISGKVSLGKAAEIAGIPYDDFIDELRKRGIRLIVGPESPEEADKELKEAKRFIVIDRPRQ